MTPRGFDGGLLVDTDREPDPSCRCLVGEVVLEALL